MTIHCSNDIFIQHKKAFNYGVLILNLILLLISFLEYIFWDRSKR
jgi:hypothetical protein